MVNNLLYKCLAMTSKHILIERTEVVKIMNINDENFNQTQYELINNDKRLAYL